MGVFGDDFTTVDFGEELCQPTPHEKANQRGMMQAVRRETAEENPACGKSGAARKRISGAAPRPHGRGVKRVAKSDRRILRSVFTETECVRLSGAD